MAINTMENVDTALNEGLPPDVPAGGDKPETGLFSLAAINGARDESESLLDIAEVAAQEIHDLREEVRSKVLDETFMWNSMVAQDIPARLAYVLSINKEKGITPEQRMVRIVNHLRGIAAERASGAIGNKCPTVFNSDNVNLDEIGMVPPDVYQGTIIYSSDKQPVRRSGASKTKAAYLNSVALDLALDAKMPRDKIREYVQKYGNIFAQNSVIPDALLLGDMEDPASIRGCIEVKGYTPDEVHTWVEALKNQDEDDLKVETEVDVGTHTLGFDPKGLKTFGHMLRMGNTSPAGFEKYDDSKEILVLRFPADAREDDLQSLGEIMRKRGISNVVIQRLPFTSDELGSLGLDLLGQYEYEIEKGNENIVVEEELDEERPPISTDAPFVYQENDISELTDEEYEELIYLRGQHMSFEKRDKAAIRALLHPEEA